MSCKHGGAAFPQVNLKDYQGLLIPDLQKGMTLRDYFAAKAMQGFIAYMGCEAEATDRLGGPNNEVIARNAYSYADAMLKAREE